MFIPGIKRHLIESGCSSAPEYGRQTRPSILQDPAQTPFWRTDDVQAPSSVTTLSSQSMYLRLSVVHGRISISPDLHGNPKDSGLGLRLHCPTQFQSGDENPTLHMEGTSHCRIAVDLESGSWVTASRATAFGPLLGFLTERGTGEALFVLQWGRRGV